MNLDEYVVQQLQHLNEESHQNGLQLSQVQETVQSAVDHVSKFLFDLVGFEAIHRQELEEQQKQVPV